MRDVVGDVEISLCNAVDKTQWLSRGNIVLVRFKPAIQGHGVVYTYDAFPQNQTVPGRFSVSACLLLCPQFYLQSI